VARLLAIADERSPALTVEAIKDIAPDIVVSCGDLPFSYVEFVASAANRPLLFVPGNHDPSLRREPVLTTRPFSYEAEWGDTIGPRGGLNLDGKIRRERGITFAGLGGSIRYRPGANQYTDREMLVRVVRLEARSLSRRIRGGGRIDVIVTHSPPRGLGDMDDNAHRGFQSFHALVKLLRPRLLLHGHIHPHGFDKPDRMLGETRVINVVPHRVVEVTP
jgi:Icc-related predicted phosphoesterase